MEDAIAATASSIEALSQQYRIIAHNLANSTTAGYKRLRSSFAESLDAQIAAAGRLPLPTSEITETTSIDFSQGAIKQTGRTLDLAIEGEGFFVVEDAEVPGGLLYTRNGAFSSNSDRMLVDFAGRTVQGRAGPVVLPAGAGLSQIHVATDGQVSAAGQVIGRLKLVRFEDTSVLEPVGGSCFRPEEGTDPLEAQAAVRQGYQEASNVSAVKELVDLIRVTRLYEANVNSIRIQDERMKDLLEVAMA